MKKSLNWKQGITLAAVAAAGLVAFGCADGVKLSAMQEQIHAQADEIHDRAYRCAPKELALAKAHEEFGRMELSYGNGRRGEDHITFADEMIKEADQKSQSMWCLDPKLQDRDGDGIIDSEDKCPDTPGVKEYFGCPNPDKDGDGVCDAWVAEMGLTDTFPCKGVDACPDEPGKLAYSGCNNPDRDGDGICDVWVKQNGLSAQFAKTCKDSDKCEEIPGMAEFMGCPNPDSDNDTVCDEWVSKNNMLAQFPNCTGLDECPYTAGPVDNNGCPVKKYSLLEVKEDKIELKQQFFFATNKTKVLAKSEPLLEELTTVLKDNPTIKIAIEGHTDNTGKYKNNIKLSQGRAKSVMQELIKRGIDKNRMTSAGYGPDRPIDTNDTPEGRANNRRVDINITAR